jgi:hypothetical protein
LWVSNLMIFIPFTYATPLGPVWFLQIWQVTWHSMCFICILFITCGQTCLNQWETNVWGHENCEFYGFETAK